MQGSAGKAVLFISVGCIYIYIKIQKIITRIAPGRTCCILFTGAAFRDGAPHRWNRKRSALGNSKFAGFHRTVRPEHRTFVTLQPGAPFLYLLQWRSHIYPCVERF